ncbi:MAG TPA: MucR family transcriptional regulator [Devosia sp.]|nr:MucR family transcriptional regulator [Devosia sp.]
MIEPKLPLKLTCDLVSAYVAHNRLPAHEVESLLRAVYHTVCDLLAGETELKPAVPIKASVTHDYLVCLEDGKRCKTLKRYLRGRYGMTPEDYRAKWKLPSDYPMTAPSYAARRSALAKDIGLGRRGGRHRKSTTAAARKSRTPSRRT